MWRPAFRLLYREVVIDPVKWVFPFQACGDTPFMSQEREYYGDQVDPLDGFPGPLRAALSLIDKHRGDDVGVTVHSFVAALVHPDCVCNLAMLPLLPAEAREAVQAAFAYCMEHPLSATVQGSIVRRLFSS